MTKTSDLANIVNGEGINSDWLPDDMPSGKILYSRDQDTTSRVLTDKLNDVVSIKDFGLAGDGSIETAALQDALNSISSGTVLSFDGLTITVDNPVKIESKEKFIVDGGNGGIVATNGMPVGDNKGLLEVAFCSNFVIRDLFLDGNRATRTPAEVFAHNLSVRSSSRFVLERVRSNNAVTDGFYFWVSTANGASNSNFFCKDFSVVDCYANNCYRQGITVICGWDFKILGGAFTGTQGTAPEAGIDLEANTGLFSPAITRGLIKGVRFESNAGTGLVISYKEGAKSFWVENCYFKGNGQDAIRTYASDTHIHGCVITEHPQSGNGTVHFIGPDPSTVVVGGSVLDCCFFGNTNTTSCITTNTRSEDILVCNNVILTQPNGSGMEIQGSNHKVLGNSIKSCGKVGIVSIATNTVFQSNYVSSSVGSGFFQESTGEDGIRILDNTFKDISSTSGYIRNRAIGTVIRGNNCSANSPTTAFGVYLDTGSSDCIVVENNFVNLNSSQPIGFNGSTISDHAIYSNRGGSSNGSRKNLNGLAFPAYDSATRPAAEDVEVGQGVFNTTTLRPNWSDGTSWYDSDGNPA